MEFTEPMAVSTPKAGTRRTGSPGPAHRPQRAGTEALQKVQAHHDALAGWSGRGQQHGQNDGGQQRQGLVQPGHQSGIVKHHKPNATFIAAAGGAMKVPTVISVKFRDRWVFSSRQILWEKLGQGKPGASRRALLYQFMMGFPRQRRERGPCGPLGEAQSDPKLGDEANSRTAVKAATPKSRNKPLGRRFGDSVSNGPSPRYFAARISASKRGWGRLGLERNSGW